MVDPFYSIPMADLGQHGVNIDSFKTNILEPLTFYTTSSYGCSLNVLTPSTAKLYFPKIISISEKIEVLIQSIKGITKKDNIPSSKIVRLYDRQSGTMIREVLSNLDGSFEFNTLSTEIQFYVIVLDDLDSVYNAQISDHLFAIG